MLGIKEKARRKRALRSALILLIFIAAAVGVILLCQNRDGHEKTAGQIETSGGGPAAKYRTRTTVKPGNMEKAAVTEEDILKGDLILVNNRNKYTFPENGELESVYELKTKSYFVRDTTVLLNRNVIFAWNGLMDDFMEYSGKKTLNIISGFRTEEDQQRLYDASLEKYGEERTRRFTAEPGGSEHHTGLAADLGIFYEKTGLSEEFDGKGKYKWVTEHAWEYGFIKRYSASKEEFTGIGEEPWHFRYVGVPHAYFMYENGLCLEEYLGAFEENGLFYDGEHLAIDCAGKSYEVYYCRGTDLYVPKNGVCTVSGNGTDGFIVTVEV